MRRVPDIIKISTENKEIYVSVIHAAMASIGIHYRCVEQNNNSAFYNEFICSYYHDTEYIIGSIIEFLERSKILVEQLKDMEYRITVHSYGSIGKMNLKVRYDNVLVSFNDVTIYAGDESPELNTPYNIRYGNVCDHLYHFNTYELFKNNLLLLECINRTTDIDSILIIGKDNDLWGRVIDLKYPHRFSKVTCCDLYEYDKFLIYDYDCVFIIPYLDSMIHTLFNAFSDSKLKIISGIQIPERQDFYAEQLHGYEYDNSIYSHFWGAWIYGKLNTSLYDKIHGFI